MPNSASEILYFIHRRAHEHSYTIVARHHCNNTYSGIYRNSELELARARFVRTRYLVGTVLLQVNAMENTCKYTYLIL